MRILLDTHIMLWAIMEDKKLPVKAGVMINDPRNEIYYSIVSIWEAAIKRLKHPDKITDYPTEELVKLCAESDFHELSLETKHVCALETLSRIKDSPSHHDPFDRILISQAKSEGMIFLTHDVLLPYYSEDCIVCV